ncbi:MAG: hypothetical protein QOE61_7094, partial [Micromonosporaceae bacterium]|nr:hypothetical protein [Micromonosporaceae bacterium]
DHLEAVLPAQTDKTREIDRLLEMMERGEFDLIAVCRALIVEP